MKRFFSDINSNSDSEEEHIPVSKKMKTDDINGMILHFIKKLNKCYTRLLSLQINSPEYSSYENIYRNESFDFLDFLDSTNDDVSSYVHLFNHKFEKLPHEYLEIEEDSETDESSYEDSEPDEEIVKTLAKQTLSKLFEFNLDEQMSNKSMLDTIKESTLSIDDKTRITKKYNDILNFRKSQVPDKFKVIDLNIPVCVRSEILEKMEMLDKSPTEDLKTREWINNVMKIPFGKYTQMPVNNKSGKDIANFIKNFKETLDKAIYGQTRVKETLTEIIIKWITGNNDKGCCIAISGPAGCGKTSLIREGLAKALQRPFCSFSLAGVSDENYLSGFPFTYEGANCGRFAKMVMDTQCMNPIIFMDELDKVETKRSMSVFNKLIEITDFSQNHEIEDHYFGSNIKLDLSKCFFIFSLNDIDLVDPILKDRLEIININKFTLDDKQQIASKYLIPKEIEDFSFNVEISEKLLKYIISKSSTDAGVRNLKRHINQIYRKLNVLRFTNNMSYNLKIDDPDNIKLTKPMVDKLLKEVNKVPDIILHMYN